VPTAQCSECRVEIRRYSNGHIQRVLMTKQFVSIIKASQPVAFVLNVLIVSVGGSRCGRDSIRHKMAQESINEMLFVG
jgi:hypothetical protein